MVIRISSSVKDCLCLHRSVASVRIASIASFVSWGGALAKILVMWLDRCSFQDGSSIGAPPTNQISGP